MAPKHSNEVWNAVLLHVREYIGCDSKTVPSFYRVKKKNLVRSLKMAVHCHYERPGGEFKLGSIEVDADQILLQYAQWLVKAGRPDGEIAYLLADPQSMEELDKFLDDLKLNGVRVREAEARDRATKAELDRIAMQKRAEESARQRVREEKERERKRVEAEIEVKKRKQEAEDLKAVLSLKLKDAQDNGEAEVIKEVKRQLRSIAISDAKTKVREWSPPWWMPVVTALALLLLVRWLLRQCPSVTFS